MTRRYVVEALFLDGTWMDAGWQVSDENGEEMPCRFDSRAEAEEEIRDHVATCHAAGITGYRVSHYRVRVTRQD